MQELVEGVADSEPNAALVSKGPVAELFRVYEVPLYVLAATIFAAIYAGYVLTYTTANVFWDQWEQAKILIDSYLHVLSFGQLWAQHNINRMLFPNIIDLLLGRLFRSEAYPAVIVSLILQIASYAILTWAVLRETSNATRAVTFVGLSILFLSATYEQDSLWSFQLAWFIVVFCLVAAVCISATTSRGSALAVLLTLALLASFSSLQGLLVAPTATVVYLLRKQWRFALMTSAAWLIYLAVYMYHLNLSDTGGPGIFTSLRDPILAGKFFFVLLGSIFGSVGLAPLGFQPLELLGLVIVVSCLVTAIMLVRRFDQASTLSFVGSGLVAYGLAFAILTTVGRTGFGLPEAESSRYSLNTLLIPIGMLLISSDFAVRSYRSRIADTGLRNFIFGFAVVSACFANPVMLNQADQFHAEMLKSIALTANWRTAPQSAVTTLVYPNYHTFRVRVAELSHFRLDGFGSATFKFLELEGPLPATPSLSPLSTPRGTALSKQMQQAWMVLSSVYFRRPDLQAAFPSTTAAKSLDCRLTTWAVDTVSSKLDSAYQLLAQYGHSYRSLRREFCD